MEAPIMPQPARLPFVPGMTTARTHGPMEDPMIIRTLDEVIGTERDVAGEGWRSRRLLLKRDAMGFSLHDTVVEAGWEKEMEYANHLEACYLLQGEAEITDLASGQQYQLGPGRSTPSRTTTAIGCSEDELRLVCVFNPALSGPEVHVDGGFELSGITIEPRAPRSRKNAWRSRRHRPAPGQMLQPSGRCSHGRRRRID